jgi:SSS family solute:Na+ symporter
MEYIGIADILVFLGFVASVLFIGLWMSRGEETDSDHGASDYFLAGRKLTWWLVGFSLIAANISTEQFVGMSGQAADWLGMAIASYEWMAAITLVVVAFVFLPTFLRSGIYTIPEFLEYRYNALARQLMAVATLIILVGVPTASVIYSGAKVVTGNFQGLELLGLDFGSITVGCYIIGTLGAIYVFAGGLKACAWADLLQGSALILGGVIIAFFAMKMLADADPSELIKTARNDEVTVEGLQDAGAVQRFWDLNKGDLPEGKTHMVRPRDDTKIPWTALIVGLWIPNFFYWGLNQYITQRTLGSKSLAEGQKGIVFAAFLKLIIPFIVVIPGILAFNLFNSDLEEDAVYRNALILAEKSPQLYQRLSDKMKPDPQEKRNQLAVEQIEALLQKTPPADQGVTLYEFGDVFADVHPEDAAAVMVYNQQQVGEQIQFETQLAENAQPIELANFSKDFTGAAKEQIGDTVTVEELVAHDYDNAFPTLIRRLLPIGVGVKGFVLAAIFGAVVSSLASMLNSASTIATMDLYRAIHPKASQYTLVTMGRVFVVLFVLIAMVIAPYLGDPRFGGIFNFIQEFQGFISPGILAIFLFGLLVHRAPRAVGWVGLLLNPILYGTLKYSAPDIAFLDRMAICFFAVIAVLTVITIIKPLDQPINLPENKQMDMQASQGAKAFGMIVVCLTLALYILFW